MGIHLKGLAVVALVSFLIVSTDDARTRAPIFNDVGFSSLCPGECCICGWPSTGCEEKAVKKACRDGCGAQYKPVDCMTGQAGHPKCSENDDIISCSKWPDR